MISPDLGTTLHAQWSQHDEVVDWKYWFQFIEIATFNLCSEETYQHLYSLYLISAGSIKVSWKVVEIIFFPSHPLLELFIISIEKKSIIQLC